jgi:hypothetical protein
MVGGDVGRVLCMAMKDVVTTVYFVGKRSMQVSSETRWFNFPYKIASKHARCLLCEHSKFIYPVQDTNVVGYVT